MTYHLYLAEDFAADDFFKEWVSAPTPENDRFWRNFLREHPDRFDDLEEGRRLVAGLQSIGSADNRGLKSTSQRTVRSIWMRIEHSLDGLDAPLKRPIWRRGFWQVAAGLLLALGAGGWWLGQRSADAANTSFGTEGSSDWKLAVNEGRQSMVIQLADGSQVSLSQYSRLRYPAEFGATERKVYLTGDAFFEVTKNPQAPFLVYTNTIVTKVLGTSFEVKSSPDSSDVTVEVRTGRVSVYANDSDLHQDPEAKGIILTPNQKAVYHRPNASIRKALVDKPILLVPVNKMEQFVFEAAPASEVFRALGEAYGIDVVYDEEVLKNCLLTINLTDEDLYQKLKVISMVIDIHYKFIDGQIVIFSRGC